MKIDVAKLTYLGTCIDQVVDWGLDTLNSTSHQLRRWIFSVEPNKPNTRPFKQPQEQATVKRYKNHFKQLLYYTFRTASLDAQTCDRLYGIQFTLEQRQLIQEIHRMLNEGEDAVQQDIDDDYRASGRDQFWDEEDEDEDEDEEDWEDDEDDDEDDDDENNDEDEDNDDGRKSNDEIAMESVSISDKI
jgi:hypothetical protein